MKIATFPIRRVFLLGGALLAPAFQAADADAASAPKSPAPRQRLPFNADWKFQKNDPEGARDELDYAKIRPYLLPSSNDFRRASQRAARPNGAGAEPGAALSFALPDFDDAKWRGLNLPHDWGIEGPFDQKLPGETGKLPWWGVGWYRKSFTLPASDAGRKISLEVDGAMSYAAVWLNGHFVGGWPYGYSSWRLDLSPYFLAGAKNVLAIRLDNPPESSRWYPGGGIYRNVWLLKSAPLHLAQWGTFITTPKVNAEAATVDVQTTLQNDGPKRATVSLISTILDANDRPLAELKQGAITLAPGQSTSVRGQIELTTPILWSLKNPHRYRLVSRIVEGKVTLDRGETAFGVRTLEFDAARGFFLNGERTKIQGVCNHHDLGALGAAINVRAMQRQIEILQEMGCNAIRATHNPPAPELLELCDRMGILVIDEFSDTWRAPKKPNGYQKLFDDWAEADVRAMVRRDRNHPCIIMWSTGNEIGEQGSAAGAALSRRLSSWVRGEDPTRPITVGANDLRAGYNGFQTTVDAFGYNYKPAEYAKFRQSNPNLPLYGSETASTISSRGEYFFPVTNDKKGGQSDFQMSSYDLYAPYWATTPDTEFRGQDENPGVMGEFVWTGFDYLGEPTPYSSDSSNLLNFFDPIEKARAEAQLKELGRITVPSRSSYFGIIDLAGFKKDRFYLYQSHWRPDLPMAHLLPHWNWPDRVGQITPIHLYTSGDEAELFVNGVSQGRKKKAPRDYRLRWDDVVYQPGEVRAVVYKNGQPWARDTIKTTGDAAQLMLKADRSALKNDGADLSFVTVSVADAQGLMVPRAKNRVKFSLDGPGEIIATDNGDATNQESFQAHERAAFNGLVLVVIRTKKGASGTIRLRATAPGLKSAEIVVTSAGIGN